MWLETERQTCGQAIKVGGQNPVLDNSIDKDHCFIVYTTSRKKKIALKQKRGGQLLPPPPDPPLPRSMLSQNLLKVRMDLGWDPTVGFFGVDCYQYC